MAGREVLSSVPLQMLLYLSGIYLLIFFIGEVLLFIYKGEVLTYPSDNLAVDVILLFLLCGMEVLRIFFASKGNLTERTLTMLGSVMLLVPTVVLVVYFLVWQTYVLRMDVILTGIFLGLQCIELILSLVSMVVFGRHS
ncbi:transmembrane protein 216-like [Styela clava]|uniref:transmembrane protein 216-like n=1 Tax=Styela clava TaxID=7725 RepID=UPI00193A9D92|nr:transmembrane protein 216-like [Styela clava]XP_039254252.1 transmembrane protein 216-like [Styela clava]